MAGLQKAMAAKPKPVKPKTGWPKPGEPGYRSMGQMPPARKDRSPSRNELH